MNWCRISSINSMLLFDQIPFVKTHDHCHPVRLRLGHNSCHIMYILCFFSFTIVIVIKKTPVEFPTKKINGCTFSAVKEPNETEEFEIIREKRSTGQRKDETQVVLELQRELDKALGS